MSVVSMIQGAVGPDSAQIVAKVDGGGPVRVAVAGNSNMIGAQLSAPVAVDGQGVAKVPVSGLDPSTRYWWQVEDNGALDASLTGQILTHPPLGQPANFVIAAGSCAGADSGFPGSGSELAPGRLSNHPVFDTIREQGLLRNVLGFHYLGDACYYDPGSGAFTPDASVGTYRTMWDDILAQARQHQLARTIGIDHVWDDHEFGPNDSDGTFAFKANAAQVWRERLPHGTLPDANAIYRDRMIGRVLVVMADVRYNRSPNTDPDGASKTMLGAAQKSWMDSLLAGTEAEFLIWMMGSQWLHTSADSWASFQTEQAEMIQMLGDHGFLGRTRIVYGDRHGAGIDSGANSPGGIPVLACASLDSTPTTPVLAELYDTLTDTPGRGHWGTVTIQDTGSLIMARMSAWSGASLLGSHQAGLSLGAAPVASGALVRTLSGSHTPVIEARIVTGHPTGPDPEGTTLQVIGGEVTFDGSAEVRGQLTLHTPGRSDATGGSTFPRFATDDLSPHGNEIFVRYGVSLGGAPTIWTPLGYYRWRRVTQAAGGAWGELTLRGQDRMSGLIRAGLLNPRSYDSARTVGSVVSELITQVYPDAVIIWDDDSDQEPLGRTVVVEESSYQAVKDIADSKGKLFYVDDEGAFRIEAAPDEDVPVWRVNAGRGGVQASAARAVDVTEVFNGVILKGHALSGSAVRAVAIDNNPASPTYFFGQFGQSVTQVESILVTSQSAAEQAVLAHLRRGLPALYELQFEAQPNPTLRPWQPVEGVHQDGNSEVYVMQRLTIPLGRGPMSGLGRTRIAAAVMLA